MSPGPITGCTVSHSSRRASTYVGFFGHRDWGMQRQRGAGGAGICLELTCRPSYRRLLSVVSGRSLGASIHLRRISGRASPVSLSNALYGSTSASWVWYAQPREVTTEAARTDSERGRRLRVASGRQDDQALLDEVECPKDSVCLADRHNEELAVGVPVDAVVAAGASLSAFRDSLARCPSSALIRVT